jgi:hypothetical protein
MRRQRFDVTPELMVHLGSGTFKVIANELPPDVKIVRSGYDQERDTFSVVLEHESFPDVPEGRIPFAKPPVIERL